MRIRTFFTRHAVGFLAFLLPALDLLFRCPKGFSGWAATWYALDYSLGSGSRLLVGSLLRLLCGGYVTTGAAVNFVIGACLLTAVLYALLMDRLYLSCPEQTKWPAAFVILLTSVAPFSLRYLWNAANFGRLDLFLALILFAGLLVCLRLKNPWVRAAAASGISIAALLVHQIYFFIFFPALLALLITDAFNGERVCIRRLLPAFCAAALVAVCFLGVQLFSSIRADDPDALIALLSKTSDLDVSRSAVEYEYFQDFSYSFQNLTKPFLLSPTSLVSLLLTLVLMSPAVLLYIFLFRDMFASLKRRGIPVFRSPQLYLLMLLVCYLPPFVLAVDWNRWLGALFLSFALILLTLLGLGDEAARDAFSGLGDAMRRRPWLFVVLLIYFAAMSSFRAREFLPEVQAIIGLIGRVL